MSLLGTSLHSVSYLNMLYEAMAPIARNDGTRPKPHTDCECSSDTWERREVSVSPPSSSTWGITRSGVSWLEFFESLTKFSVRSIPAMNAVWASDRATTRFTRMRGRCFRQSLEAEKRESLYQVENLIIMIIIAATLLYTYAHFHWVRRERMFPVIDKLMPTYVMLSRAIPWPPSTCWRSTFHLSQKKAQHLTSICRWKNYHETNDNWHFHCQIFQIFCEFFISHYHLPGNCPVS